MKNTPFLIAVIVIIIGVVGFLVYHSQASSTITLNEASIASLESQATSLGNQLTTANTEITTLQTQALADGNQINTLQNDLSTSTAQAASLQGQVTSANGQITTLQTQLATITSQAASLQTQFDTANAQLATLQTQVGTSSTQITSLQNQLATANTQIVTLQASITTLQSTLSLSLSTTELNESALTQAAGAETMIVSFTADNAGYVYVAGTSSSATAFIRVTGSYGGYTYTGSHIFGTSNTVIIPVLPGTVYVYFGNTDSSGTPTADISVTYDY